ncbi:hypothetical protein OWV82_012087 [Melia azedarach]|uniref:Uncharacterized protein n=1 Tax=Melia azedarach TaxID=155640 RepID=A0ACC1Y1W7_MELAZ|nr:hypothetical protein OWV82_012087 [Melia azedarach]
MHVVMNFLGHFFFMIVFFFNVFHEFNVGIKNSYELFLFLNIYKSIYLYLFFYKFIKDFMKVLDYLAFNLFLLRELRIDFQVHDIKFRNKGSPNDIWVVSLNALRGNFCVVDIDEDHMD